MNFSSYPLPWTPSLWRHPRDGKNSTHPQWLQTLVGKRKGTSGRRSQVLKEPRGNQRMCNCLHNAELPPKYILRSFSHFFVCLFSVVFTSIELAILRHSSIPGMSNWITRRSLHFTMMLPREPTNLKKRQKTKNCQDVIKNLAPVNKSHNDS